jgi:hypothetical protein
MARRAARPNRARRVALRHFSKNRAQQIERMIEEMTYISEHLSSLRQEITDLRNMNARYASKSERGPLDQSALEVRTNRLQQIKQELSNMLDRPGDPKIWWEKLR